jgi:hypothetical protein
MTSTKTPTNNQDKPGKKNRKSAPQPYSAQDKLQAVLAVWTERCKPIDVCRQLKVNWITFNQWQRRALEGMLQALENRVNLTKGQALSPRLQTLLQRQQRTMNQARLTSRLEQVNRLASHPAETAKDS